MVEADPILTQRVDALEQLAQAQVVEQVGELTERVAGLESARHTEEPHLATKADIVRLEARFEQLDAKIDSVHDTLDAKIDAQTKQFDSKLETQTEQLLKRMEQRMNQQLIWTVGSGLAIVALILSRLPA